MAGDAFQKFKSSVNKGITTISVKTSSTLEKSKIKTHIESLNKDIERDYISIGEEAFEIWNAGNNDYSSLIERFKIVKQKQNEVLELNSQLESIDERDNQILGTNTTKPQESEPTKYICTNCGAQYEIPVKFCRKCGNQIQE